LKPQRETLDIFYDNYVLHGKLSAVHPDNNDGRRYTIEYRAIREREYRTGINDVGLELYPGCNLLDFGAQDLVFLVVCRELQPGLGETVAMDYGIEAHEYNKHILRHINYFYSSAACYDIVTLWDVYEHIPDLDSFLSTLSKRVRSGGSVLVQTPRSDIYGDVLGAQWHHFLPVQHLQLPSRQGITLQFKQYGFDLIKNASFGANAPPSLIPHPYKALFDKLVKNGDLGSTQILLFQLS